MHWLPYFSIISYVVMAHGAPHQLKLLNLLTDAGVRSLFEVDSSMDVPEFDLASPTQVLGNIVTRSVPLHRYQRRSTRSAKLKDIDPYPQTTELTFNVFGIDFHLNLTKSSFIAPGMVLEGGPSGYQIDPVDPCYYHGNLIGYEEQNCVTVSTCNGLNGLVRTADHSYTIKQLPASVAPHFVTEYGNFPHVVYRRSARSGEQSHYKQSDFMTSSMRQKRGIRDLDNITEQIIELVVMVDSTVYEFYNSSDDLVEGFVLNFVNALDLLMRNPGLGAYNLNIKLLAIHFLWDSGQLQDPEEVTNQTNQCDDGTTCIGQLDLMKVLWERVNKEYHADHGLYLTKRKLCFDSMTGCQQSGYAPLGGMCGGRSSLSVARADGLQATSEEAHELGHNLGILHDGNSSKGCYDSMHIMSVSQTGTVGNDFTWSPCSAIQLADSLKDDKMSCLDNDDGLYIPVPSDFPGTDLDYDEQCKMVYGTQADGDCDKNKKAKFSCESIYCREDPDNQPNVCTEYYPPAEGTPCNTESNDEGEEYNGWCRIGECLLIGEEPQVEEGEWSDWEEGECSVTCGGGVKSFTRSCDALDGEQYCKGSNTLYELCNTELCDGECSDITADNFRNQYCSSGNARFYGGDNICNLYCGSDYERKVPDGGRQTDDPGQFADLDICIDGEPFMVGCDGSFTSGLTYDECGTCGGDNSTCTLIDGAFSEEVSDKELVYIAELIAGTTHISFQESEYVQSGYFVLRISDGTYLTNSDYTTRPEYTNTGVASPFRYDPDCNTIFTHYHPYLDVEEIVAPGPINQTIDILYYIKKSSKFQPILYSYNSPTGVTDTPATDDFANELQEVGEDDETATNEEEEGENEQEEENGTGEVNDETATNEEEEEENGQEEEENGTGEVNEDDETATNEEEEEENGQEEENGTEVNEDDETATNEEEEEENGQEEENGTEVNEDDETATNEEEEEENGQEEEENGTEVNEDDETATNEEEEEENGQEEEENGTGEVNEDDETATNEEEEEENGQEEEENGTEVNEDETATNEEEEENGQEEEENGTEVNEDDETATNEEEEDDSNGTSCNNMTYVGGMALNQEQCAAKNGKRGAYDWVYRLRTNDPCAFYCYSEEKGELAVFNGGIAEGSWCSNDVLQPKRCIEGACVDVGCDGELGGLEFDNCSVCGGNGSTCQLVQESVQLSENVTSITTFPVGASHIYVLEMDSKGPKYGKGYYILETISGNYLTGANDDGAPSEPVDKSSSYYYELDCTSFRHYKWTYESETIESDMPLTETVQLKYQYVYQKNDRFVHYKYYEPI